ncbi:Ubiquinone/menaquinone biosynthesis methyltransferase UbiE [Candidatus Sulfopaludibacter sp. SbA3]|nr:Ubiquinone/menaquinone biosynthesis methyltransferase UbiE [Candidatus Sulfopaludibacter sp. SbA3]
MTATVQKGYRGIGMEGSIARWYEKTTRKDAEEFRKLGARLQSLLPEGGDALEVAPGPGFLAVELARGGKLRVTGLDISKTFVEIARKNAADAGVRVEFRQGNASQMPFADGSFDLLACRAAFKNFSAPETALREMHRVLRVGGTGVIIDLRRDVPMSEIKRYVRRLGLSVWSRWCTTLTFRFMLLKRAYTRPELEKMLEPIGFAETEVRINEIGMEAWFVK